MKKLFLTAMCALAMLSLSAQTKPDTSKVKKPVFTPSPDKVWHLSLDVKTDEVQLLQFAVQNAPLMKTKTPADQLEALFGKLKIMNDKINLQLEQQFKADSLAFAKKKP